MQTAGLIRSTFSFTQTVPGFLRKYKQPNLCRQDLVIQQGVEVRNRTSKCNTLSAIQAAGAWRLIATTLSQKQALFPQYVGRGPVYWLYWCRGGQASVSETGLPMNSPCAVWAAWS